MRRNRHILKSMNLIFAISLMCLIALVGCTNSNSSVDQKSGEKAETVAKENDSKETDDKEETTADQETGDTQSDIDVSKANEITEGTLYDAVVEVVEVDSIKELEVQDKTNIYIDISSDSAEEFVQAAEQIVGISELRKYPGITVSTQFNKETAMITLIWDENEARYTSSCFDLTTDKEVEKVYKTNELFSKIDLMNIYDEDMDELYEKYGLTRK